MKLKLLGVDIPENPTPEEMVAYLDSHFRYDTMDSWNQAQSFAQCIKVHHLEASRDDENLMFEMLSVDVVYDDIRYILNDFGERHDYAFQIGSNGRSGGYLVLYTGGVEPSEYKSYCPHCGQRNYKVAMDGSVCGACGTERVNYKKPPRQIYTHPGRGFFDAWSNLDDEEKLEEAEYFFGIVTDFDCACEDYCAAFLDFARANKVEEQEVMVPQKVLVAVPREEE